MTIRLTCIALAIAAVPVTAWAEEPVTLAPIVTTATRTESSIATTPAPIQLIGADDIQAMGATTLRDILESTPGVHVSPSGKNMQIRGLGHADTVYLLNGRRIKGEFSNSYELERIAASMIERIEILRGPSSLLYGADALGGVVNIITRRPADGLTGGVDVQLGANENGDGARRMLSADIAGGDERLRYVLYASALRRSPYAEREVANVTVPHAGGQVRPSLHPNAQIKNRLKDSYAVDVEYRDDAEVDTVGGTLEWQLTPSFKLGFDLNYLQETRASNFISERYPTTVIQSGRPIQAARIPARQHDDNERLDTAVTLDWKATEHLDLRYRLHYGRYEKDRAIYALPWADLGYASREASLNSPNRSTLEHTIHELGSVWRPAAGHAVVAGLEHRSNDVKSTAISANKRTFRSAYVLHEWQMLRNLNAVYGLRHDDDSVGGTRLSGQAGAVWSLSPLARLRANFAQGYKAPDDRSLYVNQVNPAGVPMLGAVVVNAAQGKHAAHTLKPEISETFELGIAGGGRNWSYGITAFRTRIEDRIEQIREGAAPLTYNTFRNISQANIDGIEAEGVVPLAAGLRLRLAATALKAENDATGARLLNTPNKLASLSLDYAPADAWMLQASIRHTGKQDYLGATAIATADAYTFLNLKASYLPAGKKGMEIYGGVNNLLDEKVAKPLGSDPGPYAYVGMRYRF
jgi:outer membrane receptor for ferrienterochelin and colicins